MYVSPSIENSKQKTSPLVVTELLSVLSDELVVELLSVFDEETSLLDELLVVEETELDELSEAEELPEKIPVLSELLQPARIAVSISIAENAEKRLYFIKIPPEYLLLNLIIKPLCKIQKHITVKHL